MESLSITTCKDFEDYCLRTFDLFLQGDLFPYSLKETYRLAFNSWEEAVNELLDNGVEGFSYQKSLNDDDYQLCMQGFTHHVLMKDKSLKLIACFCNNTYKLLVNTFDIPMRYDTRVQDDGGRLKIVQVPVNGYQPKVQDPRYSGFMEANGDIVAKICFDRFLQKSGFTWRTADIAEAFGMPEEGLLCILKQNGILTMVGDEDESCKGSWELVECLRGNDFTRVKTGLDGKVENQWTYKGFFFLWLLLTKDCGITPCCERENHE